MPAFKSVEDLHKSLRAAGLAKHADGIVKSILPCQVFLRRSAADGEKNSNESRMGGFPAVPKGFRWPLQPRFRDAKKRARRLDENLSDASKPMENPFDEEGYAEMAELMSAEEIAEFRAGMEEMYDNLEPPSAEQLAQMTAVNDAEKAALFISFPMAFLGQINLSKLSVLDGFDPSLPKQGMLAIFKDIRDWDGEIKVLHFSDEDEPLVRLAPPAELVTYVDELRYSYETTWSEKTKCEVLEPHAAVSVPHHWGMPQFGNDLWEWLQEPEHQFVPEAKSGKATYFGDQLGGYPEVVQDLPEFDLMPRLKRSKVKPGKMPWRMTFSYAGEHFPSTRQMASSGDGQSYLMILEKHLAKCRFDKVIEVYQQT